MGMGSGLGCVGRGLNMPPVVLLCAVVHTSGRVVMNCFPAYAFISGSSSFPKLRDIPPICLRGCFLRRANSIPPRALSFPLRRASPVLHCTSFRHEFTFPEAADCPNSALYRQFVCAAAFLCRANSIPPRALSFPLRRAFPVLQYTFPAYAFISRRKADYPDILRLRVLLTVPGCMLVLRSAKKGRIFAP